MRRWEWRLWRCGLRIIPMEQKHPAEDDGEHHSAVLEESAGGGVHDQERLLFGVKYKSKLSPVRYRLGAPEVQYQIGQKPVPSPE